MCFFIRFKSNLKRHGGSLSSTEPPKRLTIQHNQQAIAGSDVASTSVIVVPDAAEKVEIGTVDEIMATSTSDRTMAVGELRMQLSDLTAHEIITTKPTSDRIMSACEMKTFMSNSTDDEIMATSTSDHIMSGSEMKTQLFDLTTSDHTMSVGELRSQLSELNIDLGQFIYVKSNSDLTFVKITDHKNPQVELSIVITDKFDVVVNVRGKKLDSFEKLFDNVPVKFDSVHGIELLLKTLSKCAFCSGITDSTLVSIVTHRNCHLLGAVVASDCFVCSVKCKLLSTKGMRCQSCVGLRRRLLMRNKRKTGQSVKCSDLIRSKCPNVYLSTPLKFAKLAQLARKRSALDREVASLKTKLVLYERKANTMIANNGVQMNTADSDVMQQLVKECNDSIVAQFEQNSFQQIFFEQQTKYNSLKTKCSMRWHPTIIRWCLFIKSKSAKAYDGMRAYLNLPSNRTLYDYSHYMEHGLGLNPKTVEQLVANAVKLGCFSEESRSFVGILHDEVKIKADLVYNKTSGELVGYVNLDKVSNEMQNCGDIDEMNDQLAQYLLVTMVRGVTTSLCYPLAAYATKSASTSSLYGVMWECIECLELAVGVKVLFICCDGAAQNRKLFQLYGNDDEVTYKTKHMYATDDRDIYFISDPPHLLKTARNCFANSFAHSKSRLLWFTQDISWTHVSTLYNEHCEKSELRLCPKLTRSHVELTSFSKMRVSLAAQVMSSTVANALEYVYGDSVSSTVDFIRIIN
jgi:hypothetical protein